MTTTLGKTKVKELIICSEVQKKENINKITAEVPSKDVRIASTHSITSSDINTEKSFVINNLSENKKIFTVANDTSGNNNTDSNPNKKANIFASIKGAYSSSTKNSGIHKNAKSGQRNTRSNKSSDLRSNNEMSERSLDLSEKLDKNSVNIEGDKKNLFQTIKSKKEPSKENNLELSIPKLNLPKGNPNSDNLLNKDTKPQTLIKNNNSESSEGMLAKKRKMMISNKEEELDYGPVENITYLIKILREKKLQFDYTETRTQGKKIRIKLEPTKIGGNCHDGEYDISIQYDEKKIKGIICNILKKNFIVEYQVMDSNSLIKLVKGIK